MTEVKGIELPGVGVRYEFVTEEGKRVGVVSHRSGRRGIYLADRDDPDRFRRVLGLSEKDARTGRVRSACDEQHPGPGRGHPHAAMHRGRAIGERVSCGPRLVSRAGVRREGSHPRRGNRPCGVPRSLVGIGTPVIKEVCHADR